MNRTVPQLREGTESTIDSTTGLPTSISSNGRELLAGPIGFEARAAAGSSSALAPVRCVKGAAGVAAAPERLGEGSFRWNASCDVGGLSLLLQATASYEGYLDIDATATNGGSSDVALENSSLGA